MDTHQLLMELRTSQTDLDRFVEAVVRDGMPYIVIPAAAVKAWQRREPDTWAKVAGWLAAHDVTVVAV
jgi:peptidase E